jgi:hypothetical protein
VGVQAFDNDATGRGRLAIRADDRALTPYAGLVIVGKLTRRTSRVELLDTELGVVRTARAVKRRRHGLSAGALVALLAECQIAGQECFDDIENVRADRAGAPLRAGRRDAVGTSARAGLAAQSHPCDRTCAGPPRGAADRELGRDPAEDVSFDLDATETEVYGRKKGGAARSRTGALAYNSYVVTWAHSAAARSPASWSAGNQARISAAESAAMIARATRLLPAGHGQVSARVDSAFYSAELMI